MELAPYESAFHVYSPTEAFAPYELYEC